MSKHRDHLVAKILSYEWKIENFLDREYIGGKLDSPKFLLPYEQFFIRIYPYGINNESAGWVSLFLCKATSRTEQRIECTLELKGGNGLVLASGHINNPFLPGIDGRGFNKFVERWKLISIVKCVLGFGDTLTVSCEVREADIPAVEDVSAVEAETQTSLADSFQTLSKDFEKFYLSGCHTDVVLDVRGEKFSAHRFVLASRSSVFRSMFEVDMKERETGEINVTDSNPETFGSFLLFLYSGKLDVVSSDTALDLYAAADKYDVQDLKKECCKCLAREMSVDIVCDVLRLAVLHEDHELLKNATEYFTKNANKILRTPEWQTLLRDNPTLANELFIKVAYELLD